MPGQADWKIWICLLFSGILSYGFIYHMMQYGPGVSPDSIIYMDVAKNVLAGNGLQTNTGPLTHYPPFYPILLAGAGCLGSDIVSAARYLHAFLFTGTILMMGFAAYLSSGRSLWPMVCVMLISAISVPMLEVYTMAWSEPLFIFLCLIAYTFFVHYLLRSKVYLLILSAAFFAIMNITRYAGGSLLLPVFLYFTFIDPRALTRRLRDAATVFVISFAPLAIWLVRNALVAGTATNRSLAVHPPSWTHIDKIIYILCDFWLPVIDHGWLKYPLLALMVGLMIYAAMIINPKSDRDLRFSGRPEVVFQRLLICSILTYIAFLLVSLSLFDAHMPLDRRILFPALVFSVIFIVSSIWNISTEKKKPLIWKLFLLFFALTIYINADRVIFSMDIIYNHGRGYTAKSWGDSPIIAYAKSLPENIRIYSNGADVVRFLADRPADMIPSEIDPTSRLKNDRFEDHIGLIGQDIEKKKAVVLFLKYVKFRWYLPSVQQLEQDFKLPVLHRFSDGLIFGDK